MKIAIYPGTFDPITRGHLDVLKRAAKLFDQIFIAVAHNQHKNPLFSTAQRIDLIQTNLTDIPNARVLAFDGLMVDFAKSIQAQVVIRGIRAVSDFEHEFQMAQMNRHLDSNLESLFLMPSQEYFYTSSSLIKQVARFTDESLLRFVPKNVLIALKNKLEKK